VAATALAGCRTGPAERRTATERFSVADGVERVVVRGGDGETVVRGDDGDGVRVEARKYAVGRTELSAVTVTREVTGGRLTVGAEVAPAVSFGSSGGGLEALDVRVPEGVRVERVEVDDGSARVEDVAGDLALSVDDGEAEADGVDGAVEASADDGAVTVGAADRVSGEIDDGRLRMTGAATVGDVRADDGALDLAVEGIDGDVRVEADDGTVEAALSSRLDATVVVRADDGTVRVEEGTFDALETSSGTTRGTVGDGTGRLTIEVDDGTVRLRPLSTE
jgi:hypothetical protein